MRFVPPFVAIAAALSAGHSWADDQSANVRSCLQQKVRVANAKIAEDRSWISVDVTNGLPAAIAGVRYLAKVSTLGRAVPWVNRESAMDIPGGVEPGEMRTLSLYAGTPDGASGDLVAEITVLDVIDATNKPLVGDTRYNDWAAGQSDMKCEGSN